MLHLKLLLHFNLDVYVPEINEEIARPATELILKIAQEAPFLMHEVLAISARHLSVIHPDSRQLYLSQAVELQTRAIELFNLSHSDTGRDTRIARLLFSSILGRHILADVFHHDGPDFPNFLSRFVHGIRIHSGVKAIAAQGEWTSLLETELGPLMTRGLATAVCNNVKALNESLKSLIFDSTNLDTEDKDACETALRLMETGFHDIKDPTRSEYGQRMIFMWSILLPSRYVDLLERQVSEALVLLGRYAMLLHFGAQFWQIGEAGPYLLNAVINHIGPTWEVWLQWPEGLAGHMAGGTGNSSANPSLE
ncbi:hypothetical protein Daus18300_011538 [Diaporthe australafricana]|uniref:C6 transcription factor n=1 Tax=Diaporthe australafricana TaxID=127596 RepID=A0ABR3W639_9PEZI